MSEHFTILLKWWHKNCKYLEKILRSAFKLDGPIKSYCSKSLKGISLSNACSQRRNYEYKKLAYISLVRRILGYGSACWVPCTEGEINVFGREQKKAAHFTYHVNDSDWNTLAQRKTIAHMRTF